MGQNIWSFCSLLRQVTLQVTPCIQLSGTSQTPSFCGFVKASSLRFLSLELEGETKHTHT